LQPLAELELREEEELLDEDALLAEDCQRDMA